MAGALGTGDPPTLYPSLVCRSAGGVSMCFAAPPSALHGPIYSAVLCVTQLFYTCKAAICDVLNKLVDLQNVRVSDGVFVAYRRGESPPQFSSVTSYVGGVREHLVKDLLSILPLCMEQKVPTLVQPFLKLLFRCAVARMVRH